MGGTQLQRKRMRMHADDPNCFYCRRTLKLSEATLDHVIPRAAGGTDRNGNLVLSCGDCNQRKGSKSLCQFVRLTGRKMRRLEKMGILRGGL